MTTVLLLSLFLLVLWALGRSGAPAQERRPAGLPWPERASRALDDVRRGVRTLSRLDAARRDRLGRPWA